MISVPRFTYVYYKRPDYVEVMISLISYTRILLQWELRRRIYHQMCAYNVHMEVSMWPLSGEIQYQHPDIYPEYTLKMNLV